MHCYFMRVTRLGGRASAKSDMEMACALRRPNWVRVHMGGQNDISVSNSYKAIIQQLAFQNVERRAEAICASEEDQHRIPSRFNCPLARRK